MSASASRRLGLRRADVFRLQALRALGDAEADALAFGQGTVARARDGAEVHEHVRARFTGNEAEALAVVEPLNGTGLTIRHVTTPKSNMKRSTERSKSVRVGICRCAGDRRRWR